MSEKSLRQLLDEREEKDWQAKHGPTLEKHFNAAKFQLMFEKGEVPMPYAAALALLEALRLILSMHEHPEAAAVSLTGRPYTVNLDPKAEEQVRAAIALAKPEGKPS